MPRTKKKNSGWLHASFMNPEFLLGRDGRGVRILAEFLEPEHRFENFKINDTAKALAPVTTAVAPVTKTIAPVVAPV